MKKLALIFIFDTYADNEPSYLAVALNAQDSPYIAKTVSLDKQPKTSMGGFKVIPDYSIDDCPMDFSLLVLTGGLAWLTPANEPVLKLVKYAVENKIPVAAICNACNFMAEHGFLDHIKHTGNTLQFMKSQAPHYKGDANFLEEQVACDGNIITANGTAVLEFTRTVLKYIKYKEDKEIDDFYYQNKLGFYH